jgi:periplasmic protein TonB
MSATKSRKNMILPAIVGLVLLAALVYFIVGLFSSKTVVQTDDSADSARAVAEGGMGSERSTPDDLARILAEARAAAEKTQLVSPEGSNAIELYLKALEIDPNNKIAKEALNESMPYAIDRTDQYISDGDIPQAERALALLRRADPSSSVILTTLAGKIENLRRVQAARDSNEQAATAALQQQQLLRAQEQAAAATTAEPAVTEPATATPATAPARPATTTAAEPAPRPAPPPVAAVPKPIPAPGAEDRNFQLTRKVEASYPQKALRQRLEGWVELSFTVTTSGDVGDVKVIDSQPRREFDREAIRALSQWKFKPRIENGKPVAASARQRLEFKLGG